MNRHTADCAKVVGKFPWSCTCGVDFGLSGSPRLRDTTPSGEAAPLLPCPFCGGRAEPCGITATGETSILCWGCGGETAHKATLAEAIEAWNRRVTAPSDKQGGEAGGGG